MIRLFAPIAFEIKRDVYTKFLNIQAKCFKEKAKTLFSDRIRSTVCNTKHSKVKWPTERLLTQLCYYKCYTNEITFQRLKGVNR